MKKTFLIILAALISAACSAPPTNREATNSSSTNRASEATAAPLTEADAVTKEKEIWAALEKKDYNAFAAMLAEQFIYVSGEGVHDKAASVKVVTGYAPTNIVFSDWKFVPIGNAAGVIIYTVKAAGTMNGEVVPASSMHASSIWVNRGGKWLSLYHQDCQVTTAPPPPPTKTAPKTAASPTATVAASPAATTADAEANEKAVWATLAAKQWSVFESYLSTDFIQVETFGVHDRAAAVKGVQTFDFSKSTLSDWKTVKIDDDASLVTYTAKFPGEKPDTGYHSSVWSNRSGKWIAVFHQGSPMTPPAPATKPAAKK